MTNQILDKRPWKNDKEASDIVERFSASSTKGSMNHSAAKALQGINHRQTPALIPMNKDMVGFSFFTRPMMNMSEENLKNLRIMAPLLTKDKNSYGYYIRCLLDPNVGKDAGVDSHIFDNLNPFIPVLTNFALSSSGWPDAIPYTYESEEGQYKEKWAMVDGPLNLNGLYDITYTFRNILGDVVNDLFYYWILYASLVFEDRLQPYQEMWINNEIDYNTRIYRVVLDQQKKTVRHILSADVCFPTDTPIGQRGNFDIENPFNLDSKNVSVNFKTMGVSYNDPILFDEFNALVQAFNPLMTKNLRHRTMVRIPEWAAQLLNNMGYPRINPITAELEWWMKSVEFTRLIGAEIIAAADPHFWERERALNEKENEFGGSVATMGDIGEQGIFRATPTGNVPNPPN